MWKNVTSVHLPLFTAVIGPVFLPVTSWRRQLLVQVCLCWNSGFIYTFFSCLRCPRLCPPPLPSHEDFIYSFASSATKKISDSVVGTAQTIKKTVEEGKIDGIIDNVSALVLSPVFLYWVLPFFTSVCCSLSWPHLWIWLWTVVCIYLWVWRHTHPIGSKFDGVIWWMWWRHWNDVTELLITVNCWIIIIIIISPLSWI